MPAQGDRLAFATFALLLICRAAVMNRSPPALLVRVCPSGARQKPFMTFLGSLKGRSKV